jgi:glycosyltransferase involved in cell wall biosynthesis
VVDLNILHITPYYAPAYTFGGVVSAVSGLAEAQAALGYRMMVLTTDAGSSDSPAYEVRQGVQVYRVHNVLPALRARLNLSTPRGLRHTLRQICEQTPPDVVHLHELRTVENVLFTLRKMSGPVFLSPHGTLAYNTGRGTLKRVWDALLSPRLLRRVHAIAALTAAEEDEARALCTVLRLPLPRLVRLPNGVAADFAAQIAAADGAAFRARWKLDAGPLVLYLGRLHARKGADLLLSAFANLKDEFPTARLLLAGPDQGLRAALERQAALQGLSARVTFTGLLQGPEKLAALAASNVFALPAIGEGLPVAALEAMAARLPLLITPGCNLPEIGVAQAGLIVAREIGALTDGLRALLADETARAAMGARGAALVTAAFTWPRLAARSIELYQSAQASAVELAL